MVGERVKVFPPISAVTVEPEGAVTLTASEVVVPNQSIDGVTPAIL